MNLFETDLDEEVGILEDEDLEKKLIIINDDFNTFDWVIVSLIQVCGLSGEKAMQVTIKVHHDGSCLAKTGTKKELKPMKEALNERGISAEIDD